MEVKMLHHTEVREKGAPRDASAAAWQALFEEFQMLAQGSGARDADGDWCFILLFGQGDMEQLVRWGHQSYNDPSSICSSCDCNRLQHGKPWSDLRKNAAWRECQPLPNHLYMVMQQKIKTKIKMKKII